MIENQSISKKERMDYHAGHDMLSELPLSIIHIILALVPIRDAVRTCILSRQWRYIWASLPHLVFEENYCASRGYMLISEERMEKLISNALFHHKGPIHKFKIYVPFKSSNPDINEWILCLARNDVRELILHMGDHSFTWGQVGSSIYSCEKLTNLKLSFCKLDPTPSTFKGFLFLRCLFLEEVFMSHHDIFSLVAKSPLLERFDLLKSFKSGSGFSELRIRSPNLKCLYVRGFYSELCVSAPLLAEMSIELSDKNFTTYHHEQESSICNYTNFMGDFTNLEKLSGSVYFTKYLSMGIESCHRTLVFHQLKDIDLNPVHFRDIKSISVVARLIVGSPNLQKLKIQPDYSTEGYDESEATPLSFKDFGFAPNSTFEKLRVVKISKVRGFPLEMEFLKFLLERSPLLETMNLGYISTAEEQKLTAEIQGFGRASPNVKLSFYKFSLVRGRFD